MSDQDEPMTGWDAPEDLDTELTLEASSGLRVFLLALSSYMNDANTSNGINLRSAMQHLDWNGLDFAQSALDQGQDIFACFPDNDVLIKYERPRPRHPDQTGF